VRGRGCRVWDAEGREFIDYRNGLGPVTLGYRFPAVDAAIRDQLESGIVFGHPHPLEADVAEALIECIPCAEQVRFLKTGGEAMAAAIRLARAHTRRDHIVQIGYHGWLSNCGPGVPEPAAALQHTARWADAESVTQWFARYPDRIAAVTVAAGYADMDAGRTFYPFLREITRRHGALLVFDEIVTGFRVALGGVQEHFQVLPDLAVFSKGIANGMPLSALVGSRAAMSALDHAVVSSTFGGEALSLAAARTTIATYREHAVIEHLWGRGKELWDGVNSLFEEHGMEATVAGLPPCPQFRFSGDAAPALRERFFRAAYRTGVSLYDVSYVNYSHGSGDVAETLERLARACRLC
jgi:glutamate-1-semialdehyde 2,1-aminomutase